MLYEVITDIVPPPQGADRNAYLTAVTRVDDHLVEIIRNNFV